MKTTIKYKPFEFMKHLKAIGFESEHLFVDDIVKFLMKKHNTKEVYLWWSREDDTYCIRL